LKRGRPGSRPSKLQKIGVLGQVRNIIFRFDNVDSHDIHLTALWFFEKLGLGRFPFHLEKIDAPQPGDFPELAIPNFVPLFRPKQLKENIHVFKLAWLRFDFKA
jgi:hypothetical protein